jgi:hypothetical protein
VAISTEGARPGRSPSVAKYIAWRSRGITCVEIGSAPAHRLGDVFFHARIDLGKVPCEIHAGRDFLRAATALAGAGEGVGIGGLEPERHRLGVDA